MQTALLKTFTITVMALAACGATKNTDERKAASGSDLDAGNQLCVRDCKPDPGSGPVDCSAGQTGYEYLRLWDFESGSNAPMYFYNDGSARFLNISNGVPAHYIGSPPGDLTQRCDALGNPGLTSALHVQGGPFLTWGGGMGRALSLGLPVPVLPLTGTVQRDPDEELEIGKRGLTVDIRGWDGVSFWARIGPEGQTGIRVGVGDKYTDDDLSFYNLGKYCARAKVCDCNNHKPCTLWDPASAPPGVTSGAPKGEYCFDAVSDRAPVFNPLLGDLMALSVKDNYTPCGIPGENTSGALLSHCDDNYPAFTDPDPQFLGRACTPYTLQNGTTNNYCFDPGVDPNPAEGDQRCGDIPVHTVRLTTDWKLYFVPFSSMIQQGYGKRSPASINLAGLSMMKFTWDAGWVDYWLDDVSFYRVKH